MKTVTEFQKISLVKGLEAKTALVAAGKTPEEIQTSLGESFKMEGDKLKHFVNAIEAASSNMTDLKRILVVALNEGENAPPKAVKLDESHYIPEFIVEAKRVFQKPPAKGERGGRGGKKDGPRESKWGLSPEELAAKKAGKAATAKADAAKKE